MLHWCNTFPHEIYASVILKDNKIKMWKVAASKLSRDYNIARLIEERSEYAYEEIAFTANNNEEHCKIFSKDAVDWLNQWELHEEFEGFSPFDKAPPIGLPF